MVGLEKLLPAKEDEKPLKTHNKWLEGLMSQKAQKMNADNQLDKAEPHAKYIWSKKQTQTETPMEHAKTNQISMNQMTIEMAPTRDNVETNIKEWGGEQDTHQNPIN